MQTKSFMLVRWCQHLLSGFLTTATGPLVSHLLDDKGDNKMKPWAIHRFPSIYLTVKDNLEKPQLRDWSLRHCLKWGSMESYSMPWRRKEERK